MYANIHEVEATRFIVKTKFPPKVHHLVFPLEHKAEGKKFSISNSKSTVVDDPTKVH